MTFGSLSNAHTASMDCTNLTAYYNEIDPYAAQWLRNLISAGHIAPGDVDERSIVDVRADDLRGYAQCHFFAGIGGWSIALRLAGWPDDRPVWTGSCPCQPFSAAGKGAAADDERHLWPAWFPLIAKCGPPIVFGEQVEAAVGWGWLDAVFADLEGEGYACGATVLPACGVGAPHIRQRLWFVAMDDSERNGRREGWRQGNNGRNERIVAHTDGGDGSLAHANGGDASAARQQRSGEHGQRTQDGGAGCMANTDDRSDGRERDGAKGWREFISDRVVGHSAGRGFGEQRDALEPRRGGHDDSRFEFSGMVNAAGEQVGLPGRARVARSPLAGFWHDAEWIACTDGKTRPVGPGSFPLGHGIQRRASKLRAYGNAIVPQCGQAFIEAYMSAKP